MARRLQLHEELCDVLGTRNVYFQPPENTKLEYDCIVYNRDFIQSRHANNTNYIAKDRYEITHIYRNPDDKLAHILLSKFKYCAFDRSFVSDNLYHDVFTIYY